MITVVTLWAAPIAGRSLRPTVFGPSSPIPKPVGACLDRSSEGTANNDWTSALQAANLHGLTRRRAKSERWLAPRVDRIRETTRVAARPATGTDGVMAFAGGTRTS